MSRKLVLAALLLGAIVVIAAAAVWWWTRPVPLRPLEPNWIASTTVLAGDGVPALKDGAADETRFSDPFGVAIAEDGTIYVADAGAAPAIRAIASDGLVWTIAGGARGFMDGRGSAARFDTPSAIAIDAHGVLYVADTGNNAIRRVTVSGDVSTVAGNGEPGLRDGDARDARFNAPVGVAVDRHGGVIVADTYNDRIRAIDGNGTVHTVAGSGPGFADGAAAIALFHTPCGVAVDDDGNIVVADTGNGVLRTIDRAGVVSTVSMPDAIAPISIALGKDGRRYVTDEHGRVLESSATGDWRTLAGAAPGYRNGDDADALFRAPAGVAIAGPGRLIVADAGNALIRLIAPRGRLDPRRPPSPRIAPAFDAERFALTPLLWPIAPMDGPFEVAGTSGEARGVEGAERFHAGIDVRADQGTPVSAIRSGIVARLNAVNGFNTLTESVRIGPIAYVHIRVGRSRSGAPFADARFAPVYDAQGTLVSMRVKRGARFETGDPIGTVNAFNHVHVNVGWPGEELNPLAFRLVGFEDHVPPTIAGIRLFDDEGAALVARVRGRVIVPAGRVHIVVDAWDTADLNKRGRRLGVYELGYQVLMRDGTPVPGFEAPRRTLRFDRLSADPATVRTVYAAGSGIPFYGQRRTRFLYIVTNSFSNGVASPGAWDTTSLAPGDYIVRILAADINGNIAVAKRDVPVSVTPLTASH